jgi:CRISPR type III-A-associated protein Csm2
MPEASQEPKQQQQQQQPGGGNRPPRGDRRPESGGGGGGRDRGGPQQQQNRGGGGGGDRDRDRDRGGPGGHGRGGDRDRDRRPDVMLDIDYDKLVSDPLYLDNQAHLVVSRMRDMDTGTRSQLRRLYSAIRRAVRSAESERQHEFVMLRARLAYTIARHSLRSLDTLEKLLLQVTRKNEARGYERFRDLFEAIIAYNE